MDRPGTNTVHLVGRHADTDPRAADGDSQFGFSRGDRPTDGPAEVGIVDAFVTMGAQVEDVDPPFCQMGGYRILEMHACMVGTDRYPTGEP